MNQGVTNRSKPELWNDGKKTDAWGFPNYQNLCFRPLTNSLFLSEQTKPSGTQQWHNAIRALNKHFLFLRSFETGNDITREEVGEFKNVGTPEELQIVRGSYKYKDPEGNEIVVTYTADENGFVPQGAHFPVPPAIPQEILEALAKNAEEEAKLSEAERAEIDTGRYVIH